MKISAEFDARLKRLQPAEKVRVLVLLEAPPARRGASRKETLDAVQQWAGPALAAIDAILSDRRGRRLADAPNALGAVPVEATRDGLQALATSDYVKAILEDQPISLLR